MKEKFENHGVCRQKFPLRGLSGLKVLFLSEHWSYLNLCELNWNTTKYIREIPDIMMLGFFEKHKNPPEGPKFFSDQKVDFGGKVKKKH